MNLPNNVSEATRRRNPGLYGGLSIETVAKTAADIVNQQPNKKRIRQSSRPLLNKLESDFLERLKRLHPGVTIHAQAWRVRIAGSAWYKPDFCAFVDGRWCAWETKGNAGKNIDRGKLALKVAASAFPEVEWKIVWRERGVWREQIVLP